MNPRSFMTRAPGTRTMRREAARQGPETVSTEFALLAQRRARLKRQLDLLDRQHAAASRSFLLLESRMSVLSRRMALLDPAIEGRPRPAPSDEAPATAGISPAMPPSRPAALSQPLPEPQAKATPSQSVPETIAPIVAGGASATASGSSPAHSSLRPSLVRRPVEVLVARGARTRHGVVLEY